MKNSTLNITSQADIKKEPPTSQSRTLKFYDMVNEKYLLGNPLSSEKLDRIEKATFSCDSEGNNLHCNDLHHNEKEGNDLHCCKTTKKEHFLCAPMCTTTDRSPAPENTIFITNELTRPKFEEFLPFFPPGKYLRSHDYSYFHNILYNRGRGDLSLKIDTCDLCGIRLDCEDVPIHDGMLPIACNRRICPQCAYKQLIKNLFRYKNIPNVIKNSFDLPESWRVRFWTFTALAVPGKSLRLPAMAISKALRLYWRNIYGKGSLEGGLFVIEVGEGWNVHCHALILSPYHPDLNINRDVWSKALKNYGWSGHRIEVKKITPGKNGNFNDSLIELITYPLNPEKRFKMDEFLLAHIELAFSGRNKSDKCSRILSIRRIFELGSWYGLFPVIKQDPLLCPECANEGHASRMLREPGYDDFKGHRFRKNFFKKEENWNSKLSWIESRRILKSMLKENQDQDVNAPVNAS